MKHLEENLNKTLSAISHSSIFSDHSPKAKEMKAKINKWDLIKLVSFCTAKETINNMKRQPMNWEKIFANDATDRGLISKICKQLINIKEKPHNSIKKWAEDLNRYFSKVDIQMANRNIKRCSILLIILKNADQNYNEVSLHTSKNGQH